MSQNLKLSICMLSIFSVCYANYYPMHEHQPNVNKMEHQIFHRKLNLTQNCMKINKQN